MVAIPQQLNLTELAIEGVKYPGNRNAKIGMGSIGDLCSRRMWFSFHWVSDPEEISAKLQRLFNVGIDEEPKIIADLIKIGVKVSREQELVMGFAGHVKGKIDGVGEGFPEAPKTPHLLEFKTANDSNFKRIAKKGVQEGSFDYYAQIQRYMGGKKLTRCFFIMTNKNTSARYYERVRFDKECYADLLKKEQNVILSDTPPLRYFQDSSMTCRWCRVKDVCNGATPVKTCRTCDHMDMKDNGVFYCNRHEKELDYKEQIEGCKLYSLGWGFK